MFISLLGKGSETLLEDFDAADIGYERKLPPPGVIMNSGEVVEVLQVAIPALATVFAAWVNTRPSRKITITDKDHTIYQVEGKSVAEVEKLLKTAKQIMVLETKKPETKSKKQG